MNTAQQPEHFCIHDHLLFWQTVLLFDYVHFCHPNYIYKYNLHFSCLHSLLSKIANGYMYIGN